MSTGGQAIYIFIAIEWMEWKKVGRTSHHHLAVALSSDSATLLYNSCNTEESHYQVASVYKMLLVQFARCLPLHAQQDALINLPSTHVSVALCRV